MVVRDDEIDTGQAPVFQIREDGGPCAFGFAVSEPKPENLTIASLVDAGHYAAAPGPYGPVFPNFKH